MLFNSSEFAVFILVVLLVYHGLLPRGAWRARKIFLTIASYAFYMSWNPAFGVLLLGSTLLDFAAGRWIERTTHPVARRALVGVSIAFNLGMLGFFKYGGFVAANVHDLLRLQGDPPLLDVILPVGISFYTFESLSYTIDVYRGQKACRSLLDFSLFLSFFPHLVAGPIVRPRAFLPQLTRQPEIAGSAVELGLARIAQGFVKKLVLADTLGQYVDAIWYTPGAYPVGNVLLAIYAYAFQIYFDFSGYTDIALGLSELFGLHLPENFARPYWSTSPREFWQRWHISLSTWLRDYLYVSLGGNRRGSVRTYVNLILTMLLGGLWHGAAWSFVLWGAYHGVLLAVHRALGARETAARGMAGTWLARIATFHMVCLGWVLFRAPSLAEAGQLLSGLVRPGFYGWRQASEAIAVVAVGLLLHCLPPADRVRRRFVELPPWAQGAAYAVLAVATFLLAPAGEGFIYFQF